ncbi:MAG: chemotaxis protein CheB, partial [Pseudomonadales bacterium]
YLTKDMRAWVDKSESLNSDLIGRVIALGKSKHFVRSTLVNKYQGASSKPTTSSSHVFKLSDDKPSEVAKQRGVHARPQLPRRCKIVVVGSSTGGPAALQEILTKLPANFPYPILLVQHMPNTFTSVFAERLNQQCAIEVKQAENGDKLRPGRALLAPGGKQMILDGHDKVSVLDGDQRLTYKPSVDVTYASVAKQFKGESLAVILTGMGADGRDGAKLLKAAGATVWAQSEATCTIYGMPQAVVKADAADCIIDLKDFAKHLTGN